MGSRKNYYILGMPKKEWENIDETLELEADVSFEIREEIDHAINSLAYFPMLWTVVQMEDKPVKVNYFVSKEKAQKFIEKHQDRKSATNFFLLKAYCRGEYGKDLY